MSRRIRIFVLANGVTLGLLGTWAVVEVSKNEYLQTWLANNGLLQTFALGLGSAIGLGLTSALFAVFSKAWISVRSVTWEDPAFDPSASQKVTLPGNPAPAVNEPFHDLVLPNKNLPPENLSTYIQRTNEQYRHVEVDYGPGVLSRLSPRKGRRKDTDEPNRQDTNDRGN